MYVRPFVRREDVYIWSAGRSLSDQNAAVGRISIYWWCNASAQSSLYSHAAAIRQHWRHRRVSSIAVCALRRVYSVARPMLLFTFAFSCNANCDSICILHESKLMWVRTRERHMMWIDMPVYSSKYVYMRSAFQICMRTWQFSMTEIHPLPGKLEIMMMMILHECTIGHWKTGKSCIFNINHSQFAAVLVHTKTLKFNVGELVALFPIHTRILFRMRICPREAKLILQFSDSIATKTKEVNIEKDKMSCACHRHFVNNFLEPHINMCRTLADFPDYLPINQ